MSQQFKFGCSVGSRLQSVVSDGYCLIQVEVAVVEGAHVTVIYFTQVSPSCAN